MSRIVDLPNQAAQCCTLLVNVEVCMKQTPPFYYSKNKVNAIFFPVAVQKSCAVSGLVVFSTVAWVRSFPVTLCNTRDYLNLETFRCDRPKFRIEFQNL